MGCLTLGHLFKVVRKIRLLQNKESYYIVSQIPKLLLRNSLKPCLIVISMKSALLEDNLHFIPSPEHLKSSLLALTNFI